MSESYVPSFLTIRALAAFLGYESLVVLTGLNVALVYDFQPALVVGVAPLLWTPVFSMAEFGFGVL